MERRGRLTYERLVKSLERLQGAIDAQFLEQKDSGRVTDLHRVINDALIAARAGVGGTAIASPVQLKRLVEARIVEVHERHNNTEEREEHTATASNTDRYYEHMEPSTAHDLKAVPSHISQENSRLVRTSPSPDSGKENANPTAAPPLRNTSMKKPCAVKKTAIPKQATSKRPSTANIKKRASTRTNRSKPKVPLSTASSLPATDEADRRAAAAALLGLSEQSPNKSLVTALTPSSSDITPRTKGKKRTHAVYRDDIPPAKFAQSQDQIPPPQLHKSSSPVLEQATITPSTYAHIPTLDMGVNVQQSFLLGVEYAVQHVSKHLSSTEVDVVAALSDFVMHELSLQDSSGCDQALGVHHCSEEGDTVARDTESGNKDLEQNRDAGKGFWDVI